MDLTATVAELCDEGPPFNVTLALSGIRTTAELLADQVRVGT